MSVVDLFDHSGKGPTRVDQDSNQQSSCGGQVIYLDANPKIARGVMARPLYGQIQRLLVSHGLDLTCETAASDFKIISYLIEGIFDRQGGDLASHRVVLGQTLRMVFEGDHNWEDDTNELFGDLLGKL